MNVTWTWQRLGRRADYTFLGNALTAPSDDGYLSEGIAQARTNVESHDH